MNKHNQKSTDIFNKQYVTVYLTYIKILKDRNILNFWFHTPEANENFENNFWDVEVEHLVYFNLLIF